MSTRMISHFLKIVPHSSCSIRKLLVLQYLRKKRKKKEKRKSRFQIGQRIYRCIFRPFQLQLRYFYMLTAILHNPSAYSIKSSLIRLELKIGIPSRLWYFPQFLPRRRRRHRRRHFANVSYSVFRPQNAHACAWLMPPFVCASLDATCDRKDRNQTRICARKFHGSPRAFAHARNARRD